MSRITEIIRRNPELIARIIERFMMKRFNTFWKKFDCDEDGCEECAICRHCNIEADASAVGLPFEGDKNINAYIKEKYRTNEN